MSDSVFLMPTYPALIYSSCVAQRVSQDLGIDIVKLRGNEANPNKAESTIKSENPKHVWGVGHGSPFVYTLQDMECFIASQGAKYCSYTPDLLKMFGGKVVHLLSCKTAQDLGPALVNEGGAAAYIGYFTSFWFYVGGDPCSSKAIRSMHRADLEIEVALSAGKNCWRCI